MQATAQNKLSYRETNEIMREIFTQILPEHGYTIREKQSELAHEMLESIDKRRILLAEAGVGIGKTYAYLTAAILAKYAHFNDIWLHEVYPEYGISELSEMPIVISTSSIALQKALVKEYIPQISNILLKHKIIESPLTSALRKGKQNYICEKRLRSYMRSEKNAGICVKMASLLDNRHLDLAEISGLTAQIKQKICVSGRCGNDCPYINDCRYLQFRDNNQSDKYAFQICNHNYLLADIVKRSKNQPPLIPNYQTLIIDEAHKFLQSAQQIYGIGLSNDIIPSITNEIYNSAIKQTNENQEIRTITKKLYDQNRRLFSLFNKNLEAESDDEETERYTVEVSDQVLKHFRNICNISTAIIELIANKPKFGKSKGIRLKILHNLAELKEQSDILRKYNNLIGWLEKTDENTTFFAIPKNLSDILYKDMWSKRIPIILTSGTLAANGDFSHIKRTLGLTGVKNIAETTKPSPFDYDKNVLLYFSNMDCQGFWGQKMVFTC